MKFITWKIFFCLNFALSNQRPIYTSKLKIWLNLLFYSIFKLLQSEAFIYILVHFLWFLISDLYYYYQKWEQKRPNHTILDHRNVNLLIPLLRICVWEGRLLFAIWTNGLSFSYFPNSYRYYGHIIWIIKIRLAHSLEKCQISIINREFFWLKSYVLEFNWTNAFNLDYRGWNLRLEVKLIKATHFIFEMIINIFSILYKIAKLQ